MAAGGPSRQRILEFTLTSGRKARKKKAGEAPPAGGGSSRSMTTAAAAVAGREGEKRASSSAETDRTTGVSTLPSATERGSDVDQQWRRR